MVQVMNRADIQKQLNPGLNEVFGLEYKDIKEYHAPMFDIETSEKAFEEETLQAGLGSAPVKREGAHTEFDSTQEMWTARYSHETISLGFAITREAIEDGLYDTQSKMKAKALGRSMAQTKQQKAAAIFNNGFSTSYLGGDKKPLFATDHPTLSGVAQSNKLTADLSETAMEGAIVDISLIKDDRGILASAMPRLLVVPPQNMWAAKRILNSTQSTRTATQGATGITNVNDINVINNEGLIPEGLHVNQYLSDSDAWFIRTDISNGTKMFVRVSLETKMEEQFGTDSMQYKARERYSFGWSDWRQWVGSDGSGS